VGGHYSEAAQLVGNPLQRAAGTIDWVLRSPRRRSAGRAQQARDLMDAAAESELHRTWKEDRRCVSPSPESAVNRGGPPL
jgi:hypothetical protein